MKKSFPQVTLKFAQTLDGRIATVTGDSKWISSPESIRFAHRLRSQYDAVLVGVNTVLKDNPRLDVRLVRGKNPFKVIVDTKLRTPLSAKVLKHQPLKTIFAVTQKANLGKIRRVEKLGAMVLVIPEDRKGRVDLKKLLLKLRELGIKSVLVEGGAEVLSNLINQSLVNRMVIITAPKLIGQGLSPVRNTSNERKKHHKLAEIKTYSLGNDLIVDAKLTPQTSP